MLNSLNAYYLSRGKDHVIQDVGARRKRSLERLSLCVRSRLCGRCVFHRAESVGGLRSSATGLTGVFDRRAVSRSFPVSAVAAMRLRAVRGDDETPAGAGCCCCCCCGGGGGGDGAAELSDEVMSTRYLKYPAFALSGGNKRKLAVVLANTGCPDLLLLDEPTTGFISPFNSQFVCL